MTTPLAYWIGFNAVVIVLLVIDLTLLRREKRDPSVLESVISTVIWIAIAVGFGGWLWYREGGAKGLEFFTGYIIEYSLSVDNLFIFVLIFGSFQVAADQQHRLLFWGVMGALLMRGIMIFAGTALLAKFSWLIYVFGVYIVYAGVNMLLPQKEAAVEDQWIVRVARRTLPISEGPHGDRFVLREKGRWKFTMLFLVLVVVEVTDLIFALDSIPAVFGVTTDAFIVYTSNICAILGLRSLYFLLAHAVHKLVYLHYGLAGVLIFIGGKMLVGHFYEVPTGLSLAIVGTMLGVSTIASLLKTAPAHGPHS